ncbi:MAG TPA: FxsA family protein [Acidimicrobiia bacterium]|nr:FxsA family protein [Acidimicrobiia bacterium]
MIRLLLFVGIPLLEMALLIWVGRQIGVGATLLIIVLTGVAGATMVKRQGLATWRSAQSRLAQGRFPSDEIIHGAMLLAAGIMLMTPGFLSDLTGLILLVPSARNWLRRRFGDRLARRFDDRSATRVEVWRV